MAATKKKTVKTVAKKPVAKKAVAKQASLHSEFDQPKKRKPFTVFLVVDDRAVRESWASSLREQKLTVCDYMTAMEFYRDFRKPVPGVLIADLRLRGMTAMELFEKLKSSKVDLPVVFIAGHADSPRAIQGVKNGAFDFLVKPTTPEVLLKAIARAYSAFYDVDGDFFGEDLDFIESSIQRLTEREMEVMTLVTDGLSSRQIAEELEISTKTVEAHRSRINDKMRADDLPHLVRMMLAYLDEQSTK